MRLLPTPGPLRRRGPSSWRGAASRLAGPLYAAGDAGQAYTSGHGHSGRRGSVLVQVSVRHVRPGGGLDVQTSDQPPWSSDHDTWLLTSQWVHVALQPDRLSFPLVLTVDRWEREVAVDGEPVPFLFVGSDGRWAAVGRPGGREVTVTATGWPHAGLALRTGDPREVSDQVPREP